MFDPIPLGVESVAAIMQILWYISCILNYVTFSVLWHHSNFNRLPDVTIAMPRRFLACTIIGAIGFLLYAISWITYFCNGSLYLAEGISLVLYFPAAAYIPRMCEAMMFRNEQLLDDDDKFPIVISKVRLICGFISITIFALSSLPSAIINIAV